MPEFKRNLAVVIGINHYVNGIPELKTAVNDANQLALILEENYQYQVLRVLDGEATKDKLSSLFAAFEEQTLALPNDSKIHLEADDRFLFYFAGHGFAQDGLDNADGPVGFLIPQDGQRDEDTWLKMQQLHDVLIKLPCRHLLIILDCCFAGTFRWAGREREIVRSQKVYRERYDRFIAGLAQQVITSASYDEKATDSLYRFGQRGDNQDHSPFAELLFKALNGDADFTCDGVITATEIYLYLRDKITTKQTPELSQLKRHDKGEYIFPVPGFNRNQLQAAPTLDEKTNPYKGLESFEAEDSDKFFGRTNLTQKLQEFVTTHGLTVVLGASGTGKSSLVKAGLIPQLKTQPGWRILAPFRPGESPFRALNNTLVQENLPVVDQETPEPGVKNLLARLANWSQLNPNSKLLLVIDQCEELVSISRNDNEQKQFLSGLAEAITAFPEQLRLVLTLSNDFEPQLSDTALKPYCTSARFVVPAMTREQLREAIVEPAAAKVMYFEPPTLVDELIDEVMQMPGALPLLSFTLSELYLKYIKNVREGISNERAITQADYEELGGVTRSLTQRADFEYEQLVKLDSAYAQIIKYVMLRMVAVDVGELARRKVLLSELEYPSTHNQQVQEVIRQFTEARLLVKGQDSEGNGYVEPAHDALVRGWHKLLVWKQQEQGTLILQRRLTPAAMEWNSHQPPKFYWSTNPRDWWKQFWDRRQQANFLWHTNPRLDLLKQVLDSTDDWFNQVEDDFVRRSIKCQLNNRRRTIGAVATAFAIVLGFAGYQWNQTQQAQIRSLAASSEALFVSDQQLEALIDGLKTEKQLKELIGVADDTKTRAVAQLQQVVYWARELNRLEGHQGWVYSVAWSPDGKTIASASGDKTIKLWNKDGQNFRTLKGHNGEVKSVAWSLDGQTLASASGDKTIKLWSKDGKLLRTLKGHSAEVNSVAWNKDSKTLASASNDKTIKLWSKDGKLLRTLKGHSAEVNSVAWNKDSKTLASASNDKTIKLWHKDGKLLKTLQKDIEWVNSVAWSPDGQTLASASGDKTIKLWTIADGKLLRTFRGHGDVIRSVAWSPKGAIIASASDDKTIKLWRIADGQELQTFQGHTAATGSVAWSPDGQIASASGDNTVRLWSKDSQGLKTLIGHGEGVKSVAWSPDGKIIASGSADKDIKLWSKASLEPRTLKGYDGSIKSIVWSPDGQTIAAALIDGTIRLWGVDGKELEKIKSHNSAVNSVAWSPDGQTLISSGGDGDMTLKFWKIVNGKYIRIKTLQERSVITSVAWHPDGQMIAMALADGMIALRSVDGTRLRTLQGHLEAVNSVAWSPDGQTLASASADKTIRIWSKEGKLFKTFRGHSKSVNSVAWSPDGQTLASGSADKTIKIWNQDGQEIGTLKGHSDAVNSVSFSPDGKSVASASDDKTVLLWNLELLDQDVLWQRGCEWLHDYLKTNPNVKQEERHLCDV